MRISLKNARGGLRKGRPRRPSLKAALSFVPVNRDHVAPRGAASKKSKTINVFDGCGRNKEMTLAKELFVLTYGCPCAFNGPGEGVGTRRNIRPLQMCAAWTSALLSAIVKEAVKMVGRSAQQTSLVRGVPLNGSQVQQGSGHNAGQCSFPSHVRYMRNYRISSSFMANFPRASSF